MICDDGWLWKFGEQRRGICECEELYTVSKRRGGGIMNLRFWFEKVGEIKRGYSLWIGVNIGECSSFTIFHYSNSFLLF